MDGIMRKFWWGNKQDQNHNLNLRAWVSYIAHANQRTMGILVSGKWMMSIKLSYQNQFGKQRWMRKNRRPVCSDKTTVSDTHFCMLNNGQRLRNMEGHHSISGGICFRVEDGININIRQTPGHQTQRDSKSNQKMVSLLDLER